MQHLIADARKNFNPFFYWKKIYQIYQFHRLELTSHFLCVAKHTFAKWLKYDSTKTNGLEINNYSMHYLLRLVQKNFIIQNHKLWYLLYLGLHFVLIVNSLLEINRFCFLNYCSLYILNHNDTWTSNNCNMTGRNTTESQSPFFLWYGMCGIRRIILHGYKIRASYRFTSSLKSIRTLWYIRNSKTVLSC